MLALKLFCHVPLRAKLIYLAVFLLFLYCCPSVLYMTLFFALIACLTEQRAVSELCWIASVFFLLWWFSPIASLLPVSVFLAVECWHARLDRLARQSTRTDYYINPRSGGNVYSIVNNLPSCSFVGTSAAVNNSFASSTSGCAMLNNNCTVSRVITPGCYNLSVDQPSNHVSATRPLSSFDDQPLPFASGGTLPFDSSFNNLITSIKNGLFYIGTSSQVNDLVSGIETLSITASSLVRASLVRALPNDDCFSDGSADRSSLVACRCGGTGRTSRGSCSCLGHVCSGSRCACLLRHARTRGPFFGGTDNDDSTSHHLSGLAYLGFGNSRWFMDAITRLQGQFARLTLGGGNDMPASDVALYNGKSNVDSHDINHYDTKSCSISGLKSTAHYDSHISEELSALTAKCLSVTDTIVDGKNNDGDAEINHSTCISDNGGHAYYINNRMKFSGYGSIDGVSMNGVFNGANRSGNCSVADDICSRDGADGSDVEISRHDQGLWNDVDASSILNHPGFDNDSSGGDEHLENVIIEDNNSYGSGASADLQSESGSIRSWQTNGLNNSSVHSPLYFPAINYYEDNYNPFDSDDDRSSTGTAPLYSGTAVFNEESAFGTF